MSAHCSILVDNNFTKELFFATSSDLLKHISLQPNVVFINIFQTMISGITNNLRLKFQRFKPPGCKDIGIRKFLR